MAIPGSIVAVGKLVTPGGAQGPQGPPGSVGSIPLADTTQDGLLRKVSGLTTDFVDGTNHCQPIVPQITFVRLRTFNTAGNPNFEVDQKNVGNSIGLAAMGIDRWLGAKVGATMVGTGQQIGASLPDICLPGTNFRVSRCYYRITLTTAQPVLAATDLLHLVQFVEGPQWRELSNDVHSLQLLVRSSVAGLQFGVGLRDPATTTKSLAKLAVIPSANTWTLVSFPNLPVWPSGNFNGTPGMQGYILGVCLAAGATLTSPANDTWQNGGFPGALGQSNFAASPVNSTFDVAFVQHEPGPLCTTLIDKPFTQNYDECLRYYTKTYDYDVLPGTPNNTLGIGFATQISTAQVSGPWRFPKPMAKNPSVVIYNYSTGAANSLFFVNGVSYAVTAVPNPGKGGFYAINASLPAITAGAGSHIHYTADTGW